MPSPLVRLVISVLIVCTLGLQAAVSALCRDSRSYIEPAECICPPTLWPFIDYPMYSHPHYLDEEITQPQIVAVLSDGREVIVEGADLGIDDWHYRIGVQKALRLNKATELDYWIGRYEAQHPQQSIRMLRLQNRRRRLSEDGLSTLPDVTIAEYVVR